MAAHASSAEARTPSRGALQVVKCSLCGMERPIGLMVPDGGEACADLRWYCKDAKSCTQRWTSRLREPEAESAAAEGPEAAEPERDKPESADATAEQAEQAE